MQDGAWAAFPACGPLSNPLWWHSVQDMSLCTDFSNRTGSIGLSLWHSMQLNTSALAAAGETICIIAAKNNKHSAIRPVDLMTSYRETVQPDPDVFGILVFPFMWIPLFLYKLYKAKPPDPVKPNY
jgi:hypothetical protein